MEAYRQIPFLLVFICICIGGVASVAQIRLIDGYSSNEGTVLLAFNSTWGYVCDDGWNMLDANVVCREAGFGPALAHTTGNRFKSDIKSRGIVLDDVRCAGTENRLTDCRSRTIGQHDCQTSEAAGVRCSPIRQVRRAPPAWNPLRLTAGRREIEMMAKSTFRLLLVPLRADGSGVLFAQVGRGPPGPVCSDSSTLREANVICRHLGLGLGRFIHSFDISSLIRDGHLNSSNARPVLTLGNCRGHERNISQCAVYGNNRGVPCKSNQFSLGVTCTFDLPDLVPEVGSLQSSGYVQSIPMYYMSCALEEKCASPVAFELQRNDPHWIFSSRQILRFSTIVANKGTRDFLPLRETHNWEWHLCHMHYHSMSQFAHYEIYTRHSSSHQTLATGHKASFCLEDNVCDEGAPRRFRCSQDPSVRGTQGISPGCKDVYLHDLDCQWVDVTELPYGKHVFRLVVNPEYLVAESNYTNNAIICDLDYRLDSAELSRCRHAHPFDY